MKQVFAVFAKDPQPGRVKTRLAAETSPEFAAQVAEACLRDTLDRFAAIDAQRWLVCAPKATPLLRDAAAGRYELCRQGDGHLGQRLARFLQIQVTAGAESVVVLGADSPTLPRAIVDDAFFALVDADLVLGPATDGGYYLLGVRTRLPPIFEGVPWGTATVFGDTIERLDAAWRFALLPPWYDLDTLTDLQTFRGHIRALRRAGSDPGTPHLERLLTAVAAPQSTLQERSDSVR